MLAALQGTAWIVPEGGTPLRMDPGQVAVVLGPGHYTVADDPATPPDVVIYPGGRCTRVDDGSPERRSGAGRRRWVPR